MTPQTAQPAQLYLGTLSVEAKPTIRRWFELRSTSWHDLKAALETHLHDAVPLSPPPNDETPGDNDLRLDVSVSDFRSGTHIPIHEIPFAVVMWRPSVTISARLVSLKTGSLIEHLTITRSLPWSRYVPILFSPFSHGPFRSGFGREDLLYVLNDACIELFTQINRRLRALP